MVGYCVEYIIKRRKIKNNSLPAIILFQEGYFEDKSSVAHFFSRFSALFIHNQPLLPCLKTTGSLYTY